jgi:hypothetical protein
MASSLTAAELCCSELALVVLVVGCTASCAITSALGSATVPVRFFAAVLVAFAGAEVDFLGGIMTPELIFFYVNVPMTQLTVVPLILSGRTATSFVVNCEENKVCRRTNVPSEPI